MAAITVKDGTYLVPAGQMFNYIGDAFGLLASSPDANPGLTLNGSVVATAPGTAAITGILIGDASFYNSAVTIGISGVLSVSGVEAYGYKSGAWSPDFTSHGVVQVSGLTTAYGLVTGEPGPWVFSNTGVFEVTSATGDAHGVVLGNAATFQNSGTISVTGTTSATGLEMTGFEGDFANSGMIIAQSAGHNAVGVTWMATIDSGLTWVNKGLIRADMALIVSPYVPEAAPQTFTNNGVMVGGVDLGSGAGILVNNGQITGDVSLGAGDDAYDGRNGKLEGMLSAGDGADTILGGANFDNINGNMGDDSISGGVGGNDWLLGGQGADYIMGSAGSNQIYGNMGADTLIGGAGASTLLGGQGDDLIRGGGGNDWISGDRGADTLSGGGGADTFHAASGSGLDQVTDFNRAQGDQVVLDHGTTYSVSQVGADTVVDMGAGDQLVLQNVQLSSLTSGWITVL